MMPPSRVAISAIRGKHVQERDLEQIVRSVVERVVAGAPGSGDASRTVALAGDHGGYPLKDLLVAHVRDLGWTPVDLGTNSPQAVDYPDFAASVARSVAEGRARFGIMVDGAGIGSSMAANKIPGARAALCYDLSTARNAREHNDANVLTLGSGLIGEALAKQIVATFLATDCTEERHLRRVAKIDALMQTPQEAR